MDFTHKIFRFFSHPGDTRCKNCNYLKLMHPYEGTPQPCPLMLPPAVRRTDEEQARALAPSPLPPSLPPVGVPSLRPRLRSFAVFSVRPPRRRRRQRPNIRRWRAKFAFQKVSSSLGRQEAHTHLRRRTPIETEGGGIRSGSKCIPLKISKMDPADGNVAHNPHHAVPEVNIGATAKLG